MKKAGQKEQSKHHFLHLAYWFIGFMPHGLSHEAGDHPARHAPEDDQDRAPVVQHMVFAALLMPEICSLGWKPMEKEKMENLTFLIIFPSDMFVCFGPSSRLATGIFHSWHDISSLVLVFWTGQRRVMSEPRIRADGSNTESISLSFPPPQKRQRKATRNDWCHFTLKEAG